MARDDTSVETRQRLIRSALEVFAERGYRSATLREICGQAEANIAAVNYHFGDKEQLYAAVIDHAIGVAEGRMPRVSDGRQTSAESRLRQFVVDLFQRLLGAQRPDEVCKLMSKEMIEPTPALDLMVEKIVRPTNQTLADIIAELLGPQASPELVRDCTTSVMAQCTVYHHCEAVCQRLDQLDVHDPATIERLADHVVRFSLGGIKALAGQPSNGHAAYENHEDCPSPATTSVPYGEQVADQIASRRHAEL